MRGFYRLRINIPLPTTDLFRLTDFTVFADKLAVFAMRDTAHFPRAWRVLGVGLYYWSKHQDRDKKS